MTALHGQVSNLPHNFRRRSLTEATLLSLIGGGIGLLVAYWGLEALLAIKPDGLPLGEVKLDALALAFTFGVSVLSGILFGIAPALQLANTRLQTALKEGGSGGDEGPFWRLARGVFVVAQVALSLALLRRRSIRRAYRKPSARRYGK